MGEHVKAVRLALDENFPKQLLDDLKRWLPREVDLVHITDIDRRLLGLSDRQLIIALKQLGFDGLVTNNYKMLEVPQELAAILATRSIVVAMERMGDDPIRPAGALLIALPDLAKRLIPGRANVIRLRYAQRAPTDGWQEMKLLAEKLGVAADLLYEDHKPSREELETPVLPQ